MARQAELEARVRQAVGESQGSDADEVEGEADEASLTTEEASRVIGVAKNTVITYFDKGR